MEQAEYYSWMTGENDDVEAEIERAEQIKDELREDGINVEEEK